MAPVRGHEHVEEVVGIRRIGRRFDRFHLRYADRSGRQALHAVRVPGRIDLKMFGEDTPGTLSEGVHDGRIDLERYVISQSVVDDGGDERPVRFDTRFPLDERCDDERFVACDAQLVESRPINRLDPAHGLVGKHGENLGRCCIFWHLVPGGEEEPLPSREFIDPLGQVGRQKR